MTVKAGLSRRIGGVATASLVGLLLGSCSTVPDELNPVVWYESVEDLVAGDENSADQIVITDADQQPVPGADEPFPNLSTVPDDVPETMPSGQRQAVASALVADREHARYTDEAVRRDTSDSPAAAPMTAQSDFSQDFGSGSMATASPTTSVERQVAAAPTTDVPDMAKTTAELPRRPATPPSWEGDPYAQYRDKISGGDATAAALAPVTPKPAPAPVTTTAAPPPAPAPTPTPTMAEMPEETAPAAPMKVAREFDDSDSLPWRDEPADGMASEPMEKAPAATASQPATPAAVAAVPAPTPAPAPRDDVADAYAAYESVRTAARDGSRTPYQGSQPTASAPASSAYQDYAAANPVDRMAAPAPASVPSAMPSNAPVVSPYPRASAASAPTPTVRESYAGVFSKYFQESGQPPAPQPGFPYQTSSYQVDGGGYAGTPQAASGGDQPVGIITFESSSSRLSGKDLDVVRRIADAHRTYGGTVRVVGHASSRTLVNDPNRHRQENLRISLKRAQAVAAALRKDGVPETAIVVAAMSDAEPLYSEATPLGEAANRRTEIFFDYGTRSR